MDLAGGAGSLLTRVSNTLVCNLDWTHFSIFDNGRELVRARAWCVLLQQMNSSPFTFTLGRTTKKRLTTLGLGSPVYGGLKRTNTTTVTAATDSPPEDLEAFFYPI
jgi:hypothetical protein